VSGNSGQLSLLLSVGREMSAGQAAVHCCVAAWEDNPRCGVAEGMRQSSQTVVTTPMMPTGITVGNKHMLTGSLS